MSVVATLACLGLSMLAAGCRAGATRGQILYADALEHLALGDSAVALEVLQEAAWEMPEHAPIRYLLGELFTRQGTIESRARAEKELRLAGDLEPQEALYAAVLGELLHRQGFHHAAKSELRRALRLDPQLGRAWFHLGLELQAEYVEEPTSAVLRDSTIVCFERALDADSTHAEARYRLSYLLLDRGQPERARLVARGAPDPSACPVRFGPLLTAVEFRSRRFDSASRILDSTLACMRPRERERLLEPRPLLHPDSLFCFDCTPAERDSALLQYWWALDPTPTTRVNERLLEHVARLVDADFFFEVPALGIAGRETDRGEIWLRYGPPDRMWRDIDANVRSWRWSYAQAGGGEEFLFLDTYLSGKYVRLRRHAGDDFLHKEPMEVAPERTRFRLGPAAPGWRHALRTFRGREGRAVLELAFEFDRDPGLDSVRVELAAWRGPLERLAVRARSFDTHEFWEHGSDRLLGRMRFEVPAEPIELGLTAIAVGRDSPAGAAARIVWATTARDTLQDVDAVPDAFGMSDLLPAHELGAGHGGLFDFGGVIAVPRVDRTIAEGQLHLYFEIYPGAAFLAARRPLAVTYRVQELPPSTWRFRDQFSAERRARAQRRTAVESTFELRPRNSLERQQLTIDLHNVPPGEYRLTVEVRPYTGSARVSRSLDFEIPPRLAGDD